MRQRAEPHRHDRTRFALRWPDRRGSRWRRPGPDKPLAQGVGLTQVLQMNLIFLLAPTFTDERMAQVARVASGYVYDVSLKGVTRDNDHH